MNILDFTLLTKRLILLVKALNTVMINNNIIRVEIQLDTGYLAKFFCST